MNHTNKSDIISILEKLEPSQHNVLEYDTIIFDDAAVVQIVSPKASQTSNNIAKMSYTFPYCMRLIKSSLQILCLIFTKIIALNR